jgi:cell division protein FtsQ
MSTATIRRGPRGGRTTSAVPRRRVAQRRKSRLDAWLASLPISTERLTRLLKFAIAGLIALLAWVVLSFFGVPQMLRAEAEVLVARAGFQVAKVQVRGLNRMDEAPIYNAALMEVDRSMLALDIEALRQKLLKFGWVADARISRRLPDTLVVDIVERTPVAVWQHDGKLHLVDVDGVTLEAVDERAMPDLPLVVGPDANRMTRALDELLQAAPALRPMLAAATWVGNRRWNLRFQSGETLLLPEGRPEASAALLNFARMDGTNRLLGRGIVRFDMRDPAKFVLRLPSERVSDPVGAAAPVPGGVTPVTPRAETTDGATGAGSAPDAPRAAGDTETRLKSVMKG